MHSSNAPFLLVVVLRPRRWRTASPFAQASVFGVLLAERVAQVFPPFRVRRALLLPPPVDVVALLCGYASVPRRRLITARPAPSATHATVFVALFL